MTCRLCLDKPAEVMQIFDENGGLVEGGAIEIIEKYFQIQIQFRDEISNKICLVCWRYLNEFHKFWLNIKEKQRILQIALDCTRIQGKATEDDSYAQKNSTIDRKNDIFSEPELNIVDIKNEPNLAEEFDDDCMNEDSPLLSPQASDEEKKMDGLENQLKEWNCLDVLPMLTANKVTVDRLKYLCVEDIKDMIPAIGIRAEFRSKLLTWKKREFEIDDENISIVTPIKSWLSESQRPDESLSNPSVRTILEAQDNGRAILDFFKANRFIMEVHRQELIVLLLENFFACNLKLQCKDFSYIVQQIINIFPTEKKDYYFIPRGPRKNPGGKLYDKYHNFKTKRRKIQKCLTSYEEKCDVEEFDEVQLIELKNSLKSEPALSIIADNGGFTISDVWKRTLPLRQKGPRWTNDNNDFLHEWPSFKQAFGYKLIEYDFDEKYPDRGNKLLEKWTTFKHQIRKFYEVNIKDTKSREEFSVCKEIRNSKMLSRISYDAVHEPIPESSTSFVQNDILKTLRETNTQLVKVEENQSILSQGMDTLVGNQERITIAFEEIDKNPQTMALAKGIRECKVADSKMDEVANMIPLHTITAVLEVEQRLQSPDFVRTMVKGASEDVGKVIRRMFTDDLLYKYNWKGTGEKQPLYQLTFVNKPLRDVFSTQGSLEFEKSVRKAVVRAHHRFWQNKYLQKGKTTTTAAKTTTTTATSTPTPASTHLRRTSTTTPTPASTFISILSATTTAIVSCAKTAATATAKSPSSGSGSAATTATSA
ncbi:uncharacterized protein LOC118748912 isoform X2 [Rhagoletis pomonella]|uniref:uncharacterized protein LOC118748912 isoform X2 n=1 Tax=Rhagoletis pomonella TaxID=28610 RepID=UPI00177DF106|nr:uncharacterized protein LOC118748912 isoform X2 [Rhagoletis pomonella]